jgi:DHA1 family purine base/nucleoside efflux pump-like MFS transporter
MNLRQTQITASTRPPNELVAGWLTMFVIGSDLFVVSPLLPSIAEDYSIDPGLAGLSVTVFSVSYMLSAPILGALADRIGRARVLTCCLMAFGIANLLTAVCGSFAWLLAARIMAGATAAGVTPSVYALIGSAAPGEKRATWLAIVVSGLLISLSFGAPLGILVGAFLGWPVVFAGLGVLSLLLVRANSRVWRTGHSTRSLVPAGSRLNMARVLCRLCPTMIWSTAVYSTYTYLGGGLASLGYSPEQIAEVILFYGCGAICGVLIGGRMTDRLGTEATSGIGLAALCLCLLLTRFTLDTGLLVGCAFGFTSVAAQLFFPAQQVRLANEFPNRRATVLAWNNSALFLGISLGSLIGGQAISLGGFDANLTISAAISIAGWAVNLVLRPRLPWASGAALMLPLTHHRSHGSSGASGGGRS